MDLGCPTLVSVVAEDAMQGPAHARQALGSPGRRSTIQPVVLQMNRAHGANVRNDLSIPGCLEGPAIPPKLVCTGPHRGSPTRTGVLSIALVSAMY